MDIDRTQPRPVTVPLCEDVTVMETLAPLWRRALARREARLAREAEQQEAS